MATNLKNLEGFADLDREKRLQMRLLKSIASQVSAFNEDVNQAELTSTKSEVNRCRAEFDKIQNKILTLCNQLPKKAVDEAENYLFDESAEVQSQVRTMISKIAELMKSSNENSQSTNSNGVSRKMHDSDDDEDLPKLKIPTFDGEITNFPAFKALFDDLVHNKPKMKPVRKLNYLKIALQDAKVKHLIRDAGPPLDAYNETYALLNKRYNNKRVIMNAHFSNILNADKINNSYGIRKLIDTFSFALSGLKVSGISNEDIKAWAPLLHFILCSKLDKKTRNDWEDTLKDQNNYPSYGELIDFLENRALNCESRDLEKNYETNKKDPSKKPFINSSSFITNQRNTVDDNQKDSNYQPNATGSNQKPCICCAKVHLLIECPIFASKTPSERYDIVKRHNLCTNCFGRNHGVMSCKKQRFCKLCSKKHNTLLHRDLCDPKPIGNASVSIDNESESKSEVKSVSNCYSVTKNRFLILPSAVVNFRSKCNKIKGVARVLLDICSQPTLISEALVRKFKLSTYENSSSIKGVGCNPLNSNRACQLVLQSRHSSFQIEIEGDVIPATAISHRARNLSMETVFQNLQKFKLADTAFENPVVNIPNVDMIIGIEYYHKLFINEPFYTFNEITLHHTHFGWTVSGCIDDKQAGEILYSNCVSSIDQQLELFWKIEEPAIVSTQTMEHEKCNEHFENNYRRLENGQFSVALPLKIDRSKITSNRKRALLAFYRLEKSCDSETWTQYVQFMKEYEELGHMSLVSVSDLKLPAYYIPHRCVIRPDASSTKLRVVFNASSKDGNGVSLNEACMVGPIIQPELFDVIMRFRGFKVAFTADVEKMFRSIVVDKSDCDLQRIFWRPKPNDPVKEYRLETVTYGVASSPFLATKCLDKLAESVVETQPEVAEAIRRCTYMDDFFGGGDSEEEAIRLQSSIHELLSSAGFKLRKYSSNSQRLLNHLELRQKDCANSNELFLNLSELGAALGLIWKPKEDYFCLKLNLAKEIILMRITKRVMLSEISRTFDPLGFISPVSIKGKLMIQKLWREGLKWDDNISNELENEYHTYREELLKLNSFFVERYANLTDNSTQIIGFSDASSKAMAAVVYSRWLENGMIKCNFLCSKTKVAPLKAQSIPKLELEAALLLSKAAHRVCKKQGIDTSRVICFCDAEVVLCWLDKPPEKWTPYVSNRIRKIKDYLPDANWFFVGTKENVADAPTRGISVPTFLKSNWLKGPAFLYNAEEFSFQCTRRESLKNCFAIWSEFKEKQEEYKKNTFLKDAIESFSSYERLISTFTRIKICFTKNHSITKLEARNQSLISIIRILQTTYFPEEMSLLKSNNQQGIKGKLSALLPFLDANGLIRVGGRLENSPYSNDFRHPIVLPGSSNFVEAYIRHLHEKFYHAGCSFLISFVSAKYRVVSNLYRVVKRVIQKCTRCIRYRGKTAQQLMGQLPSARVSINRPFSVVGTDLAGPFLIKCTRHRSVKFIKMYAAIFVCFCTRAVHLDILSELSAESFILTFRRFISRRGLVSEVWSDNGTNFQSASKYIASLNPVLEEYAIKNGIKWNFIPPATPHQGGLHEAGVKSAKKHLNRSMNGAVLTQEELLTVFAEIEAILNSRPLSYISKPNYSIQIITPGHFLIGASLVVPPEPAEIDPTVKLSTSYENLQNRIQSFWRSWKADYLSQMTTTQKWRKPHSNLAVNDVVLIKDSRAPPAAWPYGVVVHTYPDPDGLVRNVDVLTKGSIRRKGIVNLVPLIFDEPQSIPQSILGEHERSY